MSHYQPVEQNVPWLLVGTLTGLGVSLAVLVWWIYAYFMYWMNKPRRPMRHDYDQEEDDYEDAYVEPPPRRNPARRARSRRRRDYEDEDDF